MSTSQIKRMTTISTLRKRRNGLIQTIEQLSCEPVLTSPGHKSLLQYLESLKQEFLATQNQILNSGGTSKTETDAEEIFWQRYQMAQARILGNQ